MSKKNKKKNDGINMDDILDQLNELKKEVNGNTSRSNDSDVDIDDRIRKILKEELKNIGVKHRVAANELNDNDEDDEKTDRKPKTVEQKVDALIKLVKLLIAQSRNQQNARIGNKRMPWDDEGIGYRNNRSIAYDEYDNPIEVEVLDDDYGSNRDKVRRFFNEIGCADDSSTRFINSVFGYGYNN